MHTIFLYREELLLQQVVFAGLQELRLDATKISVFDGDDPLIRGSGARFMIPDISPGLFISHKDWFTGFSIRQGFPKKWELIGSDKTKNTVHYLLVGGKRFETGNELMLCLLQCLNGPDIQNHH